MSLSLSIATENKAKAHPFTQIIQPTIVEHNICDENSR